MTGEPHETPGLGQVLARGARRRCPRCGEGPLFHGWYSMRERCAVCDLVFEPAPGDTWGFWIAMDRMFLLVAMVLLYFGFRPDSRLVQFGFLAAIAVPLVWTMPHRQGIATALDYFLRRGSS